MKPVLLDSNGKIIASFAWHEKAVINRVHTTDRAENAQVCAAAPDLYAAVEAALNMVDGDGAPPRWDMLRAALLKARGSVPQPETTELKSGTGSQEKR